MPGLLIDRGLPHQEKGSVRIFQKIQGEWYVGVYFRVWNIPKLESRA